MRAFKKSIARSALAVLLGAGTLAAAAGIFVSQVESADASVAPEWQPDFPTFPGTRVYPMADDGELNGQAFRLGYFTVRATPQDVVRFYSAYWKGKGFLADGAGTAEGGRLTALDTRDGTLRTLAVRREGERLTVFCSVMPSAHSSSVGSLPVPPESVVNDSLVMDGAQTLTYVVPGTVDAERAALTQRLGAQGWKPVPDRTRTTATALSLEFDKPGGVVHATLARERDDRAVAVQLHESAPRASGEAEP